MKSKSFLENLPGPVRRPTVLGVLVLAVIGLGIYFAFRPAKPNGAATAYHQVKRGDFTVTVVEGGTLTAVSEVSIRNEVEGVARIISIVPEGSYVKKGDLLVELDSSSAQDQVNQQEINFEKAKFAVEQAEAQLEIMRSATNSDYTAAALKLELARLDLQKYMEGQRLVDLVEATNKVVEVLANLQVKEDTYINSTNLAAKGYETKRQVEIDRLAVLSGRNSLIMATNTAWMLVNFDTVKLLKKYESDVTQAGQELERVASQNRRKMAQYEADLITQKNTLELSEQKLLRDKRNLAATKIYAPQEGLVVYQVSENHFSSESLIEGGATVRNRQELIKLPDLSRMKVTIKVHESHVGMVQPGQPAYVILDSMPDERFPAYVERVAPLPDTQSRWGNPNLKVYNTDIYLVDVIPSVKPGVSARAEIIVTNIENALSVPIHAVTTYRGKQVVYVAGGKSAGEPRPVEVGMFNTKFIEVTKGLNEGDRVMLAPPFDTQGREAASEVAQDAKARAATNRPAARPATAPGAPAGTPSGVGDPVAMVRPGQNGPNTAAVGGDSNEPGAGTRGNRRGGMIPEELMKQYDKNGDGQLDDTEREAMRTAMAARFGGMGGPGGQGGPGGFNREEMMKRFDKNGDGQLDESERAAMRESLGGTGGGGQREGRNRRSGPDASAGGATENGNARPPGPSL